MKKNGFTIAELLIAIGIIGIVSALTIPTFTGEYHKKVYAAALSNTVSNIENAFSSLITKENVFDLFDTSPWRGLGGESLFSGSSEGVITSFITNNAANLDLTYKGSVAQAYGGNAIYSFNHARIDQYPNLNDAAIFQLKNGPFLGIVILNSSADPNARNEDAVTQEGGNLTSIAANIVIDINGAATPNIIGRDIFRFELGSDGMLYPFGGEDFRIYYNENVPVDDNGYNLTSVLVTNGYKMDY